MRLESRSASVHELFHCIQGYVGAYIRMFVATQPLKNSYGILL